MSKNADTNNRNFKVFYSEYKYLFEIAVFSTAISALFLDISPNTVPLSLLKKVQALSLFISLLAIASIILQLWAYIAHISLDKKENYFDRIITRSNLISFLLLILVILSLLVRLFWTVFSSELIFFIVLLIGAFLPSSWPMSIKIISKLKINKKAIKYIISLLSTLFLLIMGNIFFIYFTDFWSIANLSVKIIYMLVNAVFLIVWSRNTYQSLDLYKPNK